MMRIRFYTSLLILIIVLTCGCSSENTPIAEVFLGKWALYEKAEAETTTAITGEMDIYFGTDEIKFSFTTQEETQVNHSGTVFNQNLYEGPDQNTLIGWLSIEDDILRISFQDGTVYYGR